MKIKDIRPESYTKQIRCDRCGSLFDHSDVEFHEAVSIDLKAGYGSVFGDGNDVQIDLCQHCLKTTLGQWLRIIAPGQRERELAERLHQFDTERHSGEFPTAADEPFSAPEDMPVQERLPIDVELPIPNRQIGLLAGKIEVSDDFDPPQSYGDFFGFKSVRVDAEVVISAIEARSDQGVSNIADRAEFSVIKNLCRTIHERLETVAEFEAVLKRQLIRTKARLDASPVTAAIEQLANEVFETEADAWRWLNSPHPMLDSKTPLQAAETLGGEDRVKDILVSIKNGGGV